MAERRAPVYVLSSHYVKSHLRAVLFLITLSVLVFSVSAMFSSHLSEDALAARADADRPGHGPTSSAMTSASGGSARTACTVHVHGAGDTSGYVAYGVERVRSLQPSLRANPYQKIKVQPHGSGGPKANIVSEELLSTLDSLSGLASPRVSASPSTDVPESPVPSSDFEDAVHERQLHRRRAFQWSAAAAEASRWCSRNTWKTQCQPIALSRTNRSMN